MTMQSRFTNNCTIYIEGLPFDATEGQITTFFQSAGRIASIRLPRWHDSGRLRGYGHVEFEDSEGASKALELDGLISPLYSLD
jgi:nucleolin